MFWRSFAVLGGILRLEGFVLQIDFITIFPDFFRGPLDYGIIRRAREAGLVMVEVRDLRVHTRDRHRTVDDRPLAAAKAWSSSRNRFLRVWIR